MDMHMITIGGAVVALFWLGAVAVAVAASRRVSRMEARVEPRLRLLEEAAIRAPARDDVAQIDHRLRELALEQAAIVEKLRNVSNATDRIERFLMQPRTDG